MRIDNLGKTTRIWLSACETYRWANKAGAKWPCSFLSGKRLYAEFCRGDLVDLKIDGKIQDCPADELNAILDDHLTEGI